MKAESTLFSRYFVSVSMTITKVVHIWVALHMRKVLLKCDLTSTFFLMQLSFSEKEKRKKNSQFSASPQAGTRVGLMSRDGWEAFQWCCCLISNPSAKWQRHHNSNWGRKGISAHIEAWGGEKGKSSLIKTNSRISAHTSNWKIKPFIFSSWKQTPGVHVEKSSAKNYQSFEFSHLQKNYPFSTSLNIFPWFSVT